MQLPSLISGKRFTLPRPAGSADAVLLAQLAQREKKAGKLTAIVTSDAADAQRLMDELVFFAPGLRCVMFPDWETLPYDTFSPHQDLISERLATLWRIKQRNHAESADVVLVPATTALYRLAPPSFLAGYTFEFKVKQKLDEVQLKAQLTLAGYSHVSQVVSPGEYAVRGGLIDLFPMGSLVPYRVDLFDDEIDSIRTFDPDSQRSLYPVPEVRLLPGREFPMDEAARLAFRNRWRERFEGDPSKSRIYKDMGTGVATGGIEYYLPLFFDETSTLFQHLGEQATVVLHGEITEALERFWNETRERHRFLQHDPCADMARQFLVHHGNLAVRLGDHGRLATIGLLANDHRQRQRRQQLDAVLLSQLHTTTLAKQMLGMPAVRADVHGHVFHHAQHRNVDLAEHFHAFARVQQRQILRRGDDHRTGHRDFLRQGQLDIPGAGRHVDHQVIKIIPGGLGHQLQQRAGHHRATPYHRRVVVGEKRHGHDFHTMRLDRHKPLLLANLWPGAFSDAEHHALAGAIDIRIENADPGAFTGQGQSQVGSSGRLADATLARGHGDDVLDVGHGRHLGLGLVRGDHAVDRHLGTGDAVKVADCCLQYLGPAVLEQPCGIPQLQLHTDLPALDIHGAHAAGADRILVQVGVGVLAKHAFDGGTGDGTHGDSHWQTECKTGAYPNPSIVSRCDCGVKYLRQPFIVADHPHFYPVAR